MIRFWDSLRRYEASDFPQLEAAAFRAGWRAVFLDRGLCKAPGKRVPVDREIEVGTLYKTRYTGFTAKRFHELLVRDHEFNWGHTRTPREFRVPFLSIAFHSAIDKSRAAYTSVWRYMDEGVPAVEGLAGEGQEARRPPAQAAAAAPCGYDVASRWIAARWLSRQPALDLIVTMDDATSEVYPAFLVDEGGTDSTFRAPAGYLNNMARHSASPRTGAAIISLHPGRAERLTGLA